jgi:hypothetical protein
MLHHVQRLGVNIFSSSIGKVIDTRLAWTKSLESRMTISLTKHKHLFDKKVSMDEISIDYIFWESS